MTASVESVRDPEREAALDRRARRRAVAVFAVTIGLVVAGWVFLALDVAAGASAAAASAVTFDLPLLVFPVTGLLVARRQPRNSVAWVLLGIGLAGGIGSLFTGYSTYALAADPGSLSGRRLSSAPSTPPCGIP